MYNHYIPQSDGSYRRNPQPEQRRPNPPHPRPEPPRPEPPPPPPPCPPPQNQGSILDFFNELGYVCTLALESLAPIKCGRDSS